MRQRTTWNTNEILNRTAATSPTAAMNRTADPYAMNQDHIKQQPSADKYLTGDPSAFAEDITTPNNWEVEYSGGAVKRNEIGMPEDRPETFNHPEKTASVNHDLLLKKADMTVRIARRMLGSNAPEGAIEEQAASLMHLPDQEVINTYNRMANEMPPQLQKHQEQQAAKQQESAEQQAQEQAKQAAIRGDKSAFDAAVARLVQIRLANDPQQAPAQQQQQAGQQQQGQAQQQAGQQQGQVQQQAGQDQQSAWYDSKAPRPGHPGPDTGPYAGQQQQAQGQVPPPAFQQQGQGQQQMPPAQAGQQQFPGGQFPTAQGQQAPMQQQAQAPAQGVEAQVQQMIEQAAQQMQQGKQANGQQAPAPQQQQAGQQQQAQGQQAPAQQQAGQQQQAQGQQAPMQQQGAGYQQAQGQQPPAQQQAGQQQQGQMQQQGMGYQQQSGLQNPNQNISPNYQQQQAGQQQGMPVQASDDQLIDQMLMPSGGAGAGGSAGAPVAEMDIQMEAPSMDIGDVSFSPGEDDMLRQLFSNDEAMAAQQAQSAQEQGQAQQGQVQANIRTAALRTVGTRPSAGVARIGGAGAPPSRGQEVDKLTSLWQSAPDVREVFGLKTT